MSITRRSEAVLIGFAILAVSGAAGPALAQSAGRPRHTMIGMGVSGDGEAEAAAKASEANESAVPATSTNGSTGTTATAQQAPQRAVKRKKDKLAQADADAWEMEFGSRAIQGDRESSKFEEFREVPVGPFMPTLRFDSFRDRGLRYERMRVTNLGQVDGRYAFDLGDTGKWGVKLFYDKTPHVYSNSGLTPFTREGNQLVADPGLRAAGQAMASDGTFPTAATETAFNAALDSQLHRVGLSVQEDEAGVEYAFTPRHDWDVTLSIDTRSKKGAQPSGGSAGEFPDSDGGIALAEHARPIDTTTNRYDVRAEWAGRHANVEAAYERSEFQNSFNSYIVQNPFGLVNGPFDAVNMVSNPAALRFVEEPSNTADMFDLNGAWDIDARTRWVQSVSWGVMQQNQPLVPETINDVILTSGGAGGLTFTPPASPNAKVDSFLSNTRITHRFGPKTQLVARYRTWAEDNLTPVQTFTQNVIADRVVAMDTWMNAQVSYRKTNEGLTLTQDLARGYNASLAWDDEIWTRANRETGRTNDDSWKLAFNITPREKWDARLSYLWADRTSDRYDEKYAHSLRGDALPMGGVNTMGTQPSGHVFFDEANRSRHQWRLNGGWHPDDRWSLESELVGTNDEYPLTSYGLQYDHGWGYSEQVNCAINQRSQLWASYEFDASHRLIHSRDVDDVILATPADASSDWVADITEGTDTYGLGYSRVLKKGKANLDVSAFQAFSRADYRTGNPSTDNLSGGNANATAHDLPPTTERLTNVNVGVNYKLRKSIWGKFLYSWQNYDVADFAQTPVPGQPLQPYMLGADPNAARAIFMGALQPGYSVNIYQLSLNYRF